MSNFEFLKDVDNKIYQIIVDAEKLYRDEYFEQCITQTRKFAEHVCKSVLGTKRTTEKTFDEMLATLKDQPNPSEQEKEFLDDLYFLKKEGNTSVHSVSQQHKGMTALECLQRAFEVAINFAVYHKGANTSILKFEYDTEMLITGKKSKKTLKDKYLTAKAECKPKAKRSNHPQSHTMKSSSYKSKKYTSPWIFTAIAVGLSIFFVLVIFFLTL
ncbi:hypothetical protein IJZ97_05835 [bacterium]|nr:hypothetical protein [bacterium]